MNLDQYLAVETDDVKARRRVEEQHRNRKAQIEAQKAVLLKKKRQIMECQEQIRRMDRYAERAMIEDQENKAYRYLEQKHVWQERLVELMEEAGITLEPTPEDQMHQSTSELENGPDEDVRQVSEEGK